MAVDSEINCAQDRLDVLARWCLWTGLTPFRMEHDAETGRFARFTFSWRHPLTVWWLAWKVFILAATVVWIQISWEGLKSMLEEDKGFTTMAKLANQFIFVTNATILIVAPEILLSNGPQLSKASRYLNEFDTMSENLKFPSCRTRKWTVFGIVSSLCLVRSFTLVLGVKSIWFSLSQVVPFTTLWKTLISTNFTDTEISALFYVILFTYYNLRWYTCTVVFSICSYSIGYRIHCLKYSLHDRAAVNETPGHHPRYNSITFTQEL